MKRCSLGNTDRMVGKLITLPLRVGVRATQLWLRVAGEAAGTAVSLASGLLERRRDDADGWSAPVTGNGRHTPPTPTTDERAPQGPRAVTDVVGRIPTPV